VFGAGPRVAQPPPRRESSTGVTISYHQRCTDNTEGMCRMPIKGRRMGHKVYKWVEGVTKLSSRTSQRCCQPKKTNTPQEKAQLGRYVGTKHGWTSTQRESTKQKPITEGKPLAGQKLTTPRVFRKDIKMQEGSPKVEAVQSFSAYSSTTEGK